MLRSNSIKVWARFTKYLTTILRLSYDNAKVAINLDGRLIYKTAYNESKAFHG